ncbi:hypothetical protein SERLADRAFT_468767 [Serpula lacrymans var. lacrymans S7.9]|uniref:Uncharacterized protein n=1 Tax=Serpula lacrymans var. lacrymans (strain S7.9) TaxID=578457 RepID=F8NVL5_SERL9|nr:uncharacterized protein SERLADRAFT_468767 [Serpula lacrymans var. lacrymans S7.9]EGO24853.1 hypothetical protein SERLADRAFT_468767 [Serpula lacrymans var. lacrymans S7.9]
MMVEKGTSQKLWGTLTVQMYERKTKLKKERLSTKYFPNRPPPYIRPDVPFCKRVSSSGASLERLGE